MSIEKALQTRSGNSCELCQSTNSLSVYEVPQHGGKSEADSILICGVCKIQLEKRAELDNKHWNCLTTSMWSEIPAVQVVSWRMLNRFRNETWASDALEMMYLSDELLEWAKSTGDHLESDGPDFHRDENGNILQDGDTVVFTKQLDVKGSSLTVKVGTVMKNIRLVSDNKEQVEGKIDGQQVVILTKYLRKG